MVAGGTAFAVRQVSLNSTSSSSSESDQSPAQTKSDPISDAANASSQGSGGAPPQADMPSADRLSETVIFAAGRVRLEAPPTDAKASVTAAQAFQKTTSVGRYSGEYSPDRVVLALYSNDDFGKDESPPSQEGQSGTPEQRASQSEARRDQQKPAGPDPSVSPYFQRHLVWAFIFYNKPFDHGRAGIIDSDFVIVVDANSGEPLQTISQPSAEWVADHPE